MQLITRGANSVLTFTLEERRTLTSPYYLMKMKSRNTAITKRFILPSNQSAYVERFDQFTITETSGTEILTSGTVTLPASDYWYEIYEQTSSTNLNEGASNNTTPLETGIIRVLGTPDTYIAPTSPDTYTY